METIISIIEPIAVVVGFAVMILLVATVFVMHRVATDAELRQEWKVFLSAKKAGHFPDRGAEMKIRAELIKKAFYLKD